MSEWNNTPGPWEKDCNVIYVPYGGLICSVCSLPPKQEEFDGNLIAAAPELAEALEQLVTVTKHLDPCPGSLDKAQKALAKAKGEQ